MLKQANRFIRTRGFEAFLSFVLRDTASNVLGSTVIGFAVRKFRTLAKDAAGDIVASVDLAFSFHYFGISISPTQIREEIVDFLKLAKELNPKVILEIGTGSGGTLFLYTTIAAPEASIISIDLPKPSIGAGYPAFKATLFKSFEWNGQRIHLLRADSHDFNTLAEIRTILSDCQVDLLFIDGDHSYEGVKKDFEMYSPLVRKGGVVVFHDIVPCSLPNTDVAQFWTEVSGQYQHSQIVKGSEHEGFGIGILYV